MQHSPDQITAMLADVLFNEGALVDAYGALKAEAAALEKRMEAIKAALQATGKAEFRTGALFDATMSISNRETVKIEELRAKFGADVEPLIRRSKDTYTLRCVAKKAG
jgi:hypothetical protein